MAASGLAGFCRRFSKQIVSPVVKKSLKEVKKQQPQRRSFFTKCADQASSPIMMPALSPTMTEGTIVKWHKKEGDQIAPGDLLCDIQTDKAVVSMETEEEGILAKILKPENTADIKIGAMIAVMVEEGEDWKSAEIPEAPASDAPPTEREAPAKTKPEEATAPQSKTETSTTIPSPIGPSVRKLLEEYDITAGKVQPSGPNGRLLKGDILKFIKSNNLTKQDLKEATTSPVSTQQEVQPVSQAPSSQTVFIPGEEEEFIDIPLTGMRRTIAKRLTESKTTIPHAYVTIDINIGLVSKLRKQLIDDGIKVSMNDFIIKSSAMALQTVPQVNVVWQGEDVVSSRDTDISVAVATKQGLITPIVKNVAFLAVDEISSIVKDLAVRAREGKLQLHEFQGGTFTISNLGMFGISEFSAVINPPQTAIMAIGSSRLVLGEDKEPQTNMTVTLSYDSRVIGEEYASLFLETFKGFMEQPMYHFKGSLSSRLKAVL